MRLQADKTALDSKLERIRRRRKRSSLSITRRDRMLTGTVLETISGSMSISKPNRIDTAAASEAKPCPPERLRYAPAYLDCGFKMRRVSDAKKSHRTGKRTGCLVLHCPETEAVFRKMRLLAIYSLICCSTSLQRHYIFHDGWIVGHFCKRLTIPFGPRPKDQSISFDGHGVAPRSSTPSSGPGH